MTKGTPQQLIDSIEMKLEWLSPSTVNSASSVDEIDENVDEIYGADLDNQYISQLIKNVNDNITDEGMELNWSMDQSNLIGIQTTPQNKLYEYDIPLKDLVNDIDKDTDYILQAIHEVTSSTNINASEDLSDMAMDSEALYMYKDPQGILGEPGEVYSLSDIILIWHDMHDDDPSMLSYSSMDEWWQETLPYLEEISEFDNGEHWELEDRKRVLDSDGFYTEYCLYSNADKSQWICMFGDSDIYTPDSGYADAEFDSEEEAREWFDDYNGFEDDEDMF